MNHHPPRDRRARTTWALWVPGLLVALGAGVATAHGLYEVALAAQVPPSLAWLYPLITDGLALVAYASTARLSGHGRGYAWTVVVLAAGLSGLAQASYLAGGVAAAPTALRFGVGAWPAIAAAIVAHLLFILSTDGRPDSASNGTTGATPAVQHATAVQPVVQPSNPHPLSNAHPPVERSTVAPTVQPAGRPAAHDRPSNEHLPPSSAASPARDRARTAARRHAHRHGQLPTVSQLMAIADVARGTAGTALKDLRDQPTALQVVPNDHERAEP